MFGFERATLDLDILGACLLKRLRDGLMPGDYLAVELRPGIGLISGNQASQAGGADDVAR